MNNLVQTIFGSGNSSPSAHTELYRVHRKNGHPFALFPSQPAQQSRLAHLLPAQSWKARLYRQIVRWTGRLKIGFPSETEEVAFPEESALVALIRKISKSEAVPLLLPGNPEGIAPRLICLCLDESDSTVGVIKAGCTDAARELIRREHAVLRQLENLPVAMPAPRPFELIETETISAFGMEFAPGQAPGWPVEPSQLASFLTPWIDRSHLMKIADLPAWKALTIALRAADIPLSAELKDFAQRSVHPTWFHGDFAPWNVRVGADGTWTAIDWERGDADGIPGWDWLHFSLQPLVLVKKWPAHRVLAHAKTLIQSPAFHGYLTKAFPDPVPHGFPGLLLRSYLLYNWHVLQPTERQDVQEELLIDY